MCARCVRYLYVTRTQSLDELVQLAAEVVNGGLAPGGGLALLTLVETLLQLGEGLQVGVDRHGHPTVGDLVDDGGIKMAISFEI